MSVYDIPNVRIHIDTTPRISDVQPINVEITRSLYADIPSGTVRGVEWWVVRDNIIDVNF